MIRAVSVKIYALLMMLFLIRCFSASDTTYSKKDIDSTQHINNYLHSKSRIKPAIKPQTKSITTISKRYIDNKFEAYSEIIQQLGDIQIKIYSYDDYMASGKPLSKSKRDILITKSDTIILDTLFNEFDKTRIDTYILNNRVIID